MLSRDQAFKLVQDKVFKKNWIYHMLAVEAIMRGLASHFGEDEEEWGLVGLLHDIDFDCTEKAMERHGLDAEYILSGKVSENVIRAIKAHNYELIGVEPESRMDNSLIAADAISGLIIASALVMPSKRIDEVSVKTLMKKYRQKDFAKGADRNRIKFYGKLEICKEEFFEIALSSLKKIGNSLGL